MEKLDKRAVNPLGDKLARHNIPFKLSIQHQLHNRYNFKKLKSEGLYELHAFIDKTVDKGLTISQVEKQWRRNSIPEEEEIGGKIREVFHFGEDGSKFRIFGYYDRHGQLVVWKIDEKHKTHRV